jgi:hypothetical protein
MRYAILLTGAALLCGCGSDSMTEPEPPATRTIDLHLTGTATYGGEPLEGVVVAYSVVPCPYLEDCERRVTRALTDEEGRYRITAQRTCIPRDRLLETIEPERGDRLRAEIQVGPNSFCGSVDRYGSDLMCTTETQVRNFDFSHCEGL